MAATETLREFLVRLSFKTDEKSLKKFTDGVEGATKRVFKLVSAIQGAALVVGAATAKFAANMEAMYFAAAKSGAAASNLKAFGNAAKNLGASSEEAVSSIQALARFMRNTPGSEGFLRSLGVETRDANGALRDTTDIMVDLGKALAAKPYPLAKQYGDLLGIGEDTLRALMSGQFSAELEKQRRLLADSGYDKAAQDAAKFMQRLRELETRVEAVGVKIGTALLDALGPQMEAAAQWFDENAESIGQAVAGIGQAILAVSDYIIPILKTIAQGWKEIYQWASAAGRAIVDAMPTSVVDKIGTGTGWVLDKLGIRDKVDAALGLGGGSSGSGASKADPMAYFQRMGWTKGQAAGIVANLRAESGMNAGAVGDNGKAYGIAQWHPDRQEAFKKWAGKDIRQSTAEEQMAFVHHELTLGSEKKAGALLRASTNAQQAGEIVSRSYERPLAADAEAAKRGASAVQIAQQTTINVTGGGDPRATASAVAGEQGRVNQTLTRNMQTAVR